MIHPVFEIVVLKEINSLSLDSEIQDDIPSSNDLVYGDDMFHVHSVVVTQSHLTLQLMQKGQHFCSKSNGRDITHLKPLGSHM